MAASDEPAETARRAGLRYLPDDQPGIRRIRCGRGFRYETPEGTKPTDPERARIDDLVIPPAWTEVWISPDPLGHLQATGRDDEGRKQYRYHDLWHQARDAEKFESLLAFGRRLGTVRTRVAADLDGRGLARDRVLALVVRLLDETLIRVGNPQYAARESFGLTTLEVRHVDVTTPTVVFEFTGKHQVEQRVEIVDPQLRRLVGACGEVGGDQLFCYREGDEVAAIGSGDVNEYLRAIAGPKVTARDFRTWGGTVTVVEELAAHAAGGPIDASAYLAAIDVAAERLGNTRDVCRSAYVHPAVAEAAEDGTLAAAWRRSRRSSRMTRAERATLHLLAARA